MNVYLTIISVVYKSMMNHDPEKSSTMEEDVTVDDGEKDRKFIVFESQLMALFYRCHSCGLEVKLETSVVGTLLVVSGTCPDGHVLHWQSQPMVRGIAAGNLLLH